MILVNKVSRRCSDKYNLLVNKFMNREEYLRRIGIEKTNVEANLENLKFLQRQHLLHVPFENLDIHWTRPIVLENKAFYGKIVGGGRGGFCYELNGLFYELLASIGFQSKRISAKVSTGNGEFGAEYDHLAIIAKIDGKEYLVDVGFGDFTAEPLEFVLETEQQDRNGVFLIRKFDENYFEVVKKDEGIWKSEYIFTPLARNLTEVRRNVSLSANFVRITFYKRQSLLADDGKRAQNFD
jgi:N-hydroxyarylamine O-acetyltransferase